MPGRQTQEGPVSRSAIERSVGTVTPRASSPTGADQAPPQFDRCAALERERDDSLQRDVAGNDTRLFEPPDPAQHGAGRPPDLVRPFVVGQAAIGLQGEPDAPIHAIEG
jgi:hypothetical protein